MDTITIGQGYSVKFIGAQMLVMRAGDDPYLIDIASVKQGEILPRTTDEPVKWDFGNGEQASDTP